MSPSKNNNIQTSTLHCCSIDHYLKFTPRKHWGTQPQNLPHFSNTKHQTHVKFALHVYSQNHSHCCTFYKNVVRMYRNFLYSIQKCTQMENPLILSRKNKKSKSAVESHTPCWYISKQTFFVFFCFWYWW